MNGIERKLCMLADRAPARSRGPGAAPGNGSRRDPGRIHEDLMRVHEDRLPARRFVAALMRDARLGRAIDARDAWALVEELAATVSRDSGGVLWLADAGEHDDYTANHSVNVCVLALAFGMHLGLGRDELVPIGMGALLHDIGKARTPWRILQKADALTPREAAIVQRHPEDGYEIVGASAPMPAKALDVVRLHHERVGGQGYPFGLGGGEIPRHVRIAAVADAYDTMTSDRPYRRARPSGQAIRDLHNSVGACFDARLVREFIDCVHARRVERALELDGAAGGAAAGMAARAGVDAYPRIRRADTTATAGVDLLQYTG